METAPPPMPPEAPLSDVMRAGAAAHGDRPALVHGSIALGYAKVRDDVARIAGRFAELGIAPGNVVALRIRTPVTHWIVTLGLMRVGAATLSLTRNAGGELAALPGITAVICGPDEETAIPESLRRITVTRDWLDRPLPEPGALPPAEVADRTGGRVCFTSGTSGRPKAIGLDAALLGARLARTAGRAGIDNGSVLWCGLGPDTAFGFTATLATWREGGTVVLSAGGPGAFRQMHSRGVNILVASPAALGPLVRDAKATALPRLDGPAIVAGGRLTPGLRDQIRAHVCAGAKIAYGSSEAGGVTLGGAEALDIHPGRVGRAFADIEVEVVGEDGAPLPPGREGQLRVRTESTVAGYLNDPEASAAHFRDGWFYPGDIALLSAGGELTLVGRVAQILNLGGVKLPIEALEERLQALDGVEDACAFLRAQGAGEPELVVVAVAAEAVAAGLGAAIRAAFPKLPPVTLCTAPALPRGSMGKVNKQALADAVAAAGADALRPEAAGLVLRGTV